jgi:hypothetical protein
VANNQRLNATITIGSALASSVRNNIGVVQAGLRNVGAEIKTVTTRQKELDNQRKVLIKQGESVDALDREYKQLTQTLDRLRESQRRWQAVAASGVKVGQAYGSMTREVGRLVRNTTIVVGAAGGAIFGLAKSTSDLGDQVAKTADKLGLKIGALQELRYAGERSGISVDSLDASLEQMVRRTAEAVRGTGTAADAYDRLGLSAEALASMSPDEALAQIADAMDNVKSSSERLKLAVDIFGRSGAGMVNMLRGGSAALAQLRADARATGYVLSDQAVRDAEEFNDTLLDLQLGVAGLKNTIGAALMPVVTDAMSQLRFWLRENSDWVSVFSDRLANGLRENLPRIADFARGMARVGSIMAGLVNRAADMVGGFDRLAVIIGAAFAAKAVFSVLMFGKAIVGLVGALATLTGITPVVVGAIKAVTLAMAANPIGAAVVVLIGATTLIIRHWDAVGAFFVRLWDKITGVFASAADRLRAVVQWSPVGTLTAAWQPVAAFFSDTWSNIAGLFAAGRDRVGAILQWSPLQTLAGAWGRVGAFFADLWDGVKWAFSAARLSLQNALEWGPLSVIGQVWQPVTSFFGALWERVTTVFSSAADGLRGLLNWSPVGVLSAAWGTVGAFYADIWDNVASVFAAARDRIQSVLQWSPLATVSQAWQPVADWFTGLWDGITESARKAFDWIAGKLEWIGGAVGRVRSFFGFAGSEDGQQNRNTADSAGAESAPAIIRDVQARQVSQPVVQRAGDTNSYTFNINGVTNPDAVADAVRGIIERQQRQRDSAALYDTAGAF